MLSRQRIEKAIANQEIAVTCYFGKNGHELTVDNKSILDSPFNKNIYSDSLKLAMGPIIKLLNTKKTIRKALFKNMNNYVDLRKNDDCFEIDPGESIIILTNEYIRLNGRYACLIVPRISLSDVGIVVTSAYVDPYYQGVLRLHLSNQSNKVYKLHTLETIAQCFFFELSDEVPEQYKEKFSNKSVFFGQTWEEILESDRDPFPTKKIPSQTDKLESAKYQLGVVKDFLKKHSIVFLALANFVVIVSGFVIFKQDYQRTKKTVSQIDEMLEPMASEIVIEAGNLSGNKRITVEIPKADIVGVICNNDHIHYELVSGNTEKETVIVFTYIYETASQVTNEIDFSYIIIRRVEI